MSEPITDVDGEVLSDVLAFLDGFEEPQTDPDLSPLDGADSPAPSPKPGNTSSARRKQPRSPSAPSKKKARPSRPDRYWLKKHEMNRLRGEVEYLGNKLELLRQCARSPAEIKVTSALGVSIRKISRRRLGNWKLLADHEREMRERAESTNAQLREALRYQQLWTSGLDSDVGKTAQALAKISPSWSKPSTVRTRTLERKNKSKMHDATWGEILRQLYVEAYAFATGRLVAGIERFDWTRPSTSQVRARPLREWTMSFPVPQKDPRDVGSLWWRLHFKSGSAHGLCESFDEADEGMARRMEKVCKWSLPDETCGKELEMRSVSVLENRKCEDIWIAASTATVYDMSGAVLFWSTSSIVVTRECVGDEQLCVMRAHYRLHGPDAALAAGMITDYSESESDSGASSRAIDAKVGMNNWVRIMQNSNRRMQRVFLQQG